MDGDSNNPNGDAARPRCPHCGAALLRWRTPPASSWGERWHWVCFNDACPNFVEGWAWMATQYNVHASYRYRLDPETGESGPLPVWSATAHRDRILTEVDKGS